MALTKYKLGELITLCTGGNENLQFDENSVKGISINKVFMPTKADLSGVSLANYTVVYPRCFSFVTVTSRNGNKISIAYNDSEESLIVSSFYVTFKLNSFGKTVLLEDYLYMFFNRSEFDRYARRDSWGSAREYFYYDNICDVEITLPDLATQQKYVDIYNAMVANQQSYERGLEDLKLVCDGYIEDLRRRMPCKPIGDFVAQSKEKNTDGIITLEQGINIEKKFITPQRSNDNFYGRQIVRTGQIAYCTQLNNANVAVALRKGPDCIVSSVYDVIYIKDENELLPEYLMMWLSRSEFGRYVYWASQGTSYEFLSFENLAGYKIPVPDVEVQKSIVDVYNTLIARKEINEKLKKQIKDICPILIRGSLEDTK